MIKEKMPYKIILVKVGSIATKQTIAYFNTYERAIEYIQIMNSISLHDEDIKIYEIAEAEE